MTERHEVRLLAGPFDGKVVARPSGLKCLYYDGVVYEYAELPGDPNIFGLVRWEPYSDPATLDHELQRLLRQK